MIIMKNFNRHSSHGHHGSKRHELAQHAHSRGSLHFCLREKANVTGFCHGRLHTANVSNCFRLNTLHILEKHFVHT